MTKLGKQRVSENSHLRVQKKKTTVLLFVLFGSEIRSFI